MADIFNWGLTEILLLCFNLFALYIGFRFLFTRVRNKMQMVEERHRNTAGSRSLIFSSFDESE
tara:strand:+ start:359 stop:547 length:189 start_codon:yes stop_codon:yes gene_type:complete